MAGAMRKRKNFWPIVLSLLPVFIILAVLRVYPIVVAVMKSFTNWDGLYQSDWIGLANYINPSGDWSNFLVCCIGIGVAP